MTDQPTPIRRQPDDAPAQAVRQDAVPRQQPGLGKRLLRLCVRCLVVLLVLLAVAGGTALWLLRPERLTTISQQLLAEHTGAEVHVEQARLTTQGRILLRNVSLRVPQMPGDGGRLLDVDHVVIEVDRLALLSFRVLPTAIIINHPRVYLTELAEEDGFTFQKLELPQLDVDEDDPAWPDMLPAVTLRDGVFQFGRISGDQYETMGKLHLTGQLRQQPLEQGVYAFELGQGKQRRLSADVNGQPPPEPAQPIRLIGELDLEGRRLQARLEQFSFEPWQRELLPTLISQWWDQHDPEGRITSFTVDVAFDADAPADVRAVLELDDAAVTLPYGELERRMTHVSGRFRFEDRTIHIESLSGLIEDVRYTLDGTVDPFHELPLFALRVHTEVFEIPDEPEYLYALPEHVRNEYDRLNPSGRFQVRMNLHRTAADQPVTYDGEILLIDARLVYRRFAYPVEGLAGRIVINNEQVDVIDLRGRLADGGTVTIEGTIAPPRDGAAVRMLIAARQVPLDDQLREAMRPHQREVFDLFFDRDAYADLLDAGVIRTSEDATEHAETPVFDLGGRADIDVLVERDYGSDARYRSTIDVETAGIHAMLRHWPYPVVSDGGRITISEGSAVVDEVRVRGLTGATATAHGLLEPPPEGGPLAPDLTLSDIQLPLDDILLATLPQPQDRWLRELNVQGVLRGEGEMMAHPVHGIDFDIRMMLEDAEARPFGSDMVWRQLAGRGSLTRFGVEIEALEGVHEDAKLHVAGRATWVQSQQTMQMTFHCQDFPLGPQLMQMLPPQHAARTQLQKLFDGYEPTGRFDAILKLAGDLEGTDHDYDLTVQPHELSFLFNEQRIDLHNITGSMAVAADQITLHDFAADFEHGNIKLNGNINPGTTAQDASAPASQPSDTPEHEAEAVIAEDAPATPLAASLRIDLASDRLDDTTKALVPDVVRQLADQMQFHGGYRLQDATLELNPHAAAEESAMRFAGTLHLKDARALIGVDIEQFDGKLQIDIHRLAKQTLPRMNIDLSARQVTIEQRQITPLSLQIRSHAEQPDVWLLRDLRGLMYGGTVTGTGMIHGGEQQRWSVELAMQDVELKPFLLQQPSVHTPAPPADDAPQTDGEEQPGPDIDRSTQTGLLSAGLSLQAVVGQPESRQGRGVVEIHSAELYRQPLAMAVLQTANFALPVQNSFNYADARYIVHGDTVLFDRIQLRSPNTAIIGDGQMDWPTRRIDLNLFTRNPNAPDLGAITDMLDLFRDTLIGIRVTGKLDEPQTRVVSFKGVERTWQRIFGNRGEAGD